MKKLIKLKNGDEKCPHCGTTFGPPSMCPQDRYVMRKLKYNEKRRRARAARKGWAKRRAKKD